ncbi:glycosyltransferase [Tautonia sp. JC769]|uniref:glycosyltransferase family 2 protein n=1 Tax=Tautonia sp. JC769 TaxID=3232135 RepID=UPI003457571C
MSGTPTVSVQMAAYNAERYVAEAVESILAQTFADFEFLIIDDGSTDQTRAILERYGQADRRIRIISRPNRGIVETRNELLGLGRGEFVAIMDADDVAMPLRLERQVDYLRQHPECLAVGSAVRVIDPDGDPLCVWNEDALTHEQIDRIHLEGGSRGAVINQPAILMRAAAVQALGGFRRRFEPAEDLDLYLRLAEVGRLANLPEPLLCYRMLPTSAGHARKQEQLNGMWEAIAEARQRRGLPEASPPPEPQPSNLSDLKRNQFVWSWWAIRSGQLATARKHAWAYFTHRPMSLSSWRLLYCAIRGR